MDLMRDLVHDSVDALWRRSAPVLGVVALVVSARAVHAESGWPHWRGPTGNAVSPDGRPPVEWGESKNLRWKVAIAGRGSASPVVWGNRVFVSTAVPITGAPTSRTAGRGEEAGGDARRAREGQAGRRGRGGRGGAAGAPLRPQRFALHCLERATGRVLWQKTAVEATPGEGHHPSHGFASASPATDGERVYAHFGSRGLFTYDLEGKLLWKRTDFGQMRTRMGFGEGSSPTVHDDAVIVPWDHEGDSYLIALDKKTGKTIWKTERDEPSCWATPLVVERDGKAQVIVSGERFARGYDRATGRELWRCSGQTQRPVASPVAGYGLAVVGSGFRGSFIGAFRLDGRGDVKGTKAVAWTMDRNTPDVPSPLLSGRRLYFHSGRSGIVTCVDVVTGEPFFRAQRVEGIGDVYASPVAADGKVYLTARDGTTVVIEDGEELKIVATNRLDEGVDATPAIAGREIFLRGESHLYCFAEG